MERVKILNYFNKQNSLGVLIVILFSLVLIACDNNSNNGTEAKTVFTENDFGEDFELEADAAVDTSVTFLEPPDSKGSTATSTRVSDGVNGTDVMPIIIPVSSIVEICWEDDNEFAEHDVELMDSEGNEVLFHIANDECVSEMVEGGSYNLIFTHDGITDNTHAIYVRPPDDGDISENTIKLLITTDSCKKCFLAGGDFENADLSRNNLQGADLTDAKFTKANLYQSNIDDADLSGADFSFAISPNGGTYPEGTIGIAARNVGPDHDVTIINTCNESVWIGVDFIAGAYTFNGNPPNWGPGGTPSWEIKGGAQQVLKMANGIESAVISNRMGCVQEPMCCQNPNGTGCNVGKSCSSAILNGNNEGLKCPLSDGFHCVDNVALRCEVGTCNDYNNCGTAGGAEPSTTFEMSLDQPSGDFYNVSMVAGNHIRVKVEPSDPGCPTVGVCGSVPTCPWARVVQEDGTWTGINANFREPKGVEIGVCLAADKMVGNSRYDSLKRENPFKDFEKTGSEFRAMGCVAAPTGDKTKNCGDKSLDNMFFGCSPFTVNESIHAGMLPPSNGAEFGGCISEFGPGKPCTFSNCRPTKYVPGGLRSGDTNAYSIIQICDPYGQCDGEPLLQKRTAKWVDGTWPQDCMHSGCKPGQPIAATSYLESVKASCNEFGSDPKMKGAYSWQFDDPALPGLSGALGGCNKPQLNYTVTLSCN